METCNLSSEAQEIQLQFIENVPSFSEFGSGMVAAISYIVHKELFCLREFIQKKGDVETSVKTDIEKKNEEFKKIRENFIYLENTLLDTLNSEAKEDGYIDFNLTEKNRQLLGKYSEYIYLLYHARNIHEIGNTKDNTQYLKLPQWDGSRKIRIVIGNNGEKFFIKYIQVLPASGVKQLDNGTDTPEDYETVDGEYIG